MDAKSLTMVSLGPGDADLITVKGLEALRQCDAICIPTKSADRSFGRSLTHAIVVQLMDRHAFTKPLIPLYTPMRFRQDDWQRQVDTIVQQLDTHNALTFVTLGDAGIYSTVYYLLEIIQKRHPDLYARTEVIAGVTSFSQASAKARRPLCVGESGLRIVPLLQTTVPETTVYMRPTIGMDTREIPRQGDVFTFENLNYAGERIMPYKIQTIRKYMTLIIDFFKKDRHEF